jgi:putative transposase
MPRANRYFLPGYVWHITHRCHKREFLLGPRKSLIDHRSLLDFFGVGSMGKLKETYRDWVSEGLERQDFRRRQSWLTESIAFGSEGFVRDMKEKLGAKALWREIVGVKGSYEVRESIVSYEADFGPKNDGLRQKNTFFWEIFI